MSTEKLIHNLRQLKPLFKSAINPESRFCQTLEKKPFAKMANDFSKFSQELIRLLNTAGKIFINNEPIKVVDLYIKAFDQFMLGAELPLRAFFDFEIFEHIKLHLINHLKLLNSLNNIRKKLNSYIRSDIDLNGFTYLDMPNSRDSLIIKGFIDLVNQTNNDKFIENSFLIVENKIENLEDSISEFFLVDEQIDHNQNLDSFSLKNEVNEKDKKTSLNFGLNLFNLFSSTKPVEPAEKNSSNFWYKGLKI